MPPTGAWFQTWVYLGLVCGWAEGARPRFDTSTDMGLVLVPADAEIDSVIFRLRATDQDADFPLIFEITATITPVVRIDNLPCTLYNKVCQANVILTKRLMPGRLHDFAVRVRDTKGDSNSMQATISATNATTSRDKIFPHIPSLIMVPEDTKPGKELDYILVRANSWSGKPVYIELWQPKELFTIRQRQTPTQTRGVITLIGELDFETQSMYTLTIYATDPYTEPGKDTRNIAGLNIVVIVQDVQDVPPIFTLAPPLTRLNNSVQMGDVILRVHAEDGDKGVPREITYGLVSEGNPFIPFFNISETTGEIILARPLEELTQITHVGAPVVLSVVAEEIRRSRDEPPAQATVVEVGFLLGEPGNSPPYFENENYITSIPENLEPGSVIMFPEQYSTRVRDEDIGKAGVFALKLQNNNGTFEINPTVAERTADFIITVRDNTLIDYEMYKTLSFKIIAQEVGPATNLSASAAVTIFIQDVNDNPPVFDEESYVVTLSENVTAGTRVVQVHATDEDTGLFGSIKYTGITGEGSEAFTIDPDTGLITVAMGSSLDREMAAQLQLTVNARDENGKGNLGVTHLIVNLLDVNDNAPIFEKDIYEFTLNSDLTNFTTPAFIKATDADAEPPNNEIRYELIHGNYENKFYLDEITGELVLRSPITKFRRKKQSVYDHLSRKSHRGFLQSEQATQRVATRMTILLDIMNTTERTPIKSESKRQVDETERHRRKRETDILYTLTARAYDLGVPHLASETQILIVRGSAIEARIMMFVVPGERPNLTKTAETLATITGGRITVLDTRPYVSDNRASASGNNNIPAEGKRTIVVARVEQTESGAPLVDIEKIRNSLAANGVGIISGTNATNVSMTYGYKTTTKVPIDGIIHDDGDSVGTYVNKTAINSVDEEVTVYKAENKLLFWLLIILGLLMLLAIAALIICCICPGCPFYMAPRKRRVYSSEVLISRTNGRPKRHIHRKPMAIIDVTSNGKKQAWSADPTRRNWQFNRRNTKNDGLASLPGDVVYISERLPVDQVNTESLRLRDGTIYNPSRRRRLEDQERMCVEDVEERKVRDYAVTDTDSLQRHEIERGSNVLRQAYGQRYVDLELNEPAVREQHFYREGNAEVLQLVTRGQVEDDDSSQYYPTTVVVDGKDVLLQRFMQDQKTGTRHEVSMQEPEMIRIIESQRQKSLYQHQQEILLLPEALDLRHRQTEEVASNVTNLPMDDSYEAQKIDVESHIRDAHRQEISPSMPGVSSTDRLSITKDQAQTATVQSYAFHDLELARQNALLTQLLLERESRHAGGVMMDAASYLETQSLPGQVAIATQTDRTAATQTEQRVRSRSDNDESDEDSRNRKKVKTKKRCDKSETKRTRMLWMKSPIEEEEENRCFDKRLNILRKKVKEVKEGRKVSLEPKVLREISDSLDKNGGPYREKKEKSTRAYKESAEENADIGYKVLSEENNGSSTSVELSKQQCEMVSDAKSAEVSEISFDNGKYVDRTTEKKCSKKGSKTKKQKKMESIIRPSFRILEKEITMLTKKLSKFTDKKLQPTTGDESTSQERLKDSKRDSNQSITRKAEDLKDCKRSETSSSPSKEAAVTKTRQKFKYQPAQKISPGGSSEYDDTFEKKPGKKPKPGYRLGVAKHLQTSSRMKVKKQSSVQTERKDQRKQTQQNRRIEKHEDTVGKEGTKLEPKTDKTVKSLSRAQKLALIGRRENVSEEASTSISSDRVNGKESTIASREPDEKSSESSEIVAHQADQREPPKRKLYHLNEKFTDDFVTESQTEMHKEDFTDDMKETEITQQFSDDFATVTPPEYVKFGRFNGLEYTRSTIEPFSNMAKEQSAQLFEAFRNEQFDRESNTTTPLDSAVPKIFEEYQLKKPLVHCSKCATERKLVSTPEEHEQETCESLHEIKKEESEESVTHEQKTLKSIGTNEKEETDTLDERTESPKVWSDMAEYTEQGEKRKENSSTDELPSKTKEDSEDIGDIADSLQSDRESKIVELSEDENDPRERTGHDSKEYSEKEVPVEDGAMEIEQEVMEESTQKKVEDEALHTLTSNAEEKVEIVAAITDDQDVTEKPEDISEEYVTHESNSEKIKETIKVTTQAFEEVSDVDRSSEGEPVNLAIHTHPVHFIDESDNASMDVDKTGQEILKDNLLQIESGETTTFLMKEDAGANKLLSDDLAEIGIESYEVEKESRMLAKEPYDFQEENKIHADKDCTILNVITSEKEITDREQTEYIKMKEELFHEEDEEKKGEPFGAKEGSDEKVEETFVEESTGDQLSRSSDLEKSAASQPDSSKTVVENVDNADPQQEQERHVDVSDSIFTSFIDTDTLEVSEDSDSSSDISRKTTVTTRPYDTPRHRQKWQQRESLEIAVMPGMKTFEDKMDAETIETEPEEDTDSNLSLNETENVEDSITIEAVIDKRTEDVEIATERFLLAEGTSSGNEKVSDPEKLNDRNEQDIDSKTKLDEGVETVVGIIDSIKNISATIRDETSSLLSIKKLENISKENIEDESITIKEEMDKKMGTISEIMKLSSTEQTKKEKIEIENEVNKIKIKDVEVNKTTNESNKNDIPPIFSEEHAKVDSVESFSKRIKKLERPKAISTEGKKRVLEEESKEKVTPIHPRRRSRKYTDDDSEKREKDDLQKELRKEEEVPRKRTTPRSRTKIDKKCTITPKTGEIDRSKTQSKYMAWYNKRREEAEKKRLEKKKFEKKTIEDDEQLPRWVSRSLKHRTTKHAKQSTEYKTPEMTPRTRRKIKPLVNVESEQLKAIVRQGRQLRKTEGILKEDPPIQIYARTPPVSSSAQHRLVQHSEYKYEKIPLPFYLHPPPPPHPSPQLSPERSFEMQLSTLSTQCEQPEKEQHSDNTTASLQGGSRLRHQQLLEKKSVFDIAYSEAAPSQLRSDSTTPPS